MSAPSKDYKYARYLEYAFLAAAAEKAAGALLANRALTEEDRRSLENGSSFLLQVASGAQVLASGNYQANNLVGAMDALSIAMDPIQRLDHLLPNKEIDVALKGAAESVKNQLINPQTPLSNERRTTIELYKLFFDALYNAVTSALDRRSPVLGTRRARFGSEIPTP